MEHEEDPDIDEPYVPPAENVLGLKDDSQSATEQSAMENASEGTENVGCCIILALINTNLHIRLASFCHSVATPNSNLISVCFALETTGEGSSDGDNSKKPLTEEEKLQQVKR